MALMAFPRGNKRGPLTNCLDSETTTRVPGARSYVVAFVLDYMLGSLEMETGMVILSMMTSQPPVRTITSTESALVATVSEAMVGALALASKSVSLRSARWNCKC